MQGVLGAVVFKAESEQIREEGHFPPSFGMAVTWMTVYKAPLQASF